MWLPIVICLGAFALLLGPILLMQPTPSQRREARLRQMALEQGLRVHMQPPPNGAEASSRTKSMAMYCLPWTESDHARHVWVLVKRKYAHELHCHGVWDWDVECDSVNFDEFWGLLDEAPPRVVAIVAGPQGLCCFWNELGGEEIVGEIAAWLKRAAPKVINS